MLVCYSQKSRSTVRHRPARLVLDPSSSCWLTPKYRLRCRLLHTAARVTWGRCIVRPALAGHGQRRSARLLTAAVALPMRNWPPEELSSSGLTFPEVEVGGRDMTGSAAPRAAAHEVPSVLGWQADIPVANSIKLPPDPHIVDAIGGNHRLETAVADLVDNSIDAGASRVLIRFVVADHQVRSFYVVDDGRGMARDQIDGAMTVGGRRSYGSSELGHFGLGLKAASFSQADSLTVISIADDSPAVGRRWLTIKASNSFECDVVGYEFCCRELQRPWGFVSPTTGTIVRWDAIRVFPTGHDVAVTDRFVQDAATRLQQHLGMIFHRFIASSNRTRSRSVSMSKTSRRSAPVRS